MIIGSCFDGDDDMQTARKQQDVYHEALAIMIRTCVSFRKSAAIMLDDTNRQRMEDVTRIDHRTLQDVHDLLAAYWRYKTNSQQMELLLGNPTEILPCEKAWLSWLTAELGSWISEPYIVRNFLRILSYQNEPRGYLAEAELAQSILCRYPIPWSAVKFIAKKKDIVRYGRMVEDEDNYQASPYFRYQPPRSSGGTGARVWNCECTLHEKSGCGQIPCKSLVKRLEE